MVPENDNINNCGSGLVMEKAEQQKIETSSNEKRPGTVEYLRVHGTTECPAKSEQPQTLNNLGHPANFQKHPKAPKKKRKPRIRHAPYSKYPVFAPATLSSPGATCPNPSIAQALLPRNFHSNIALALDFMTHINYDELNNFGRKLSETVNNPQARLRATSEQLGAISAIVCYSIPPEFSL
ncbi:unnamed protein product [Leptidea sinapis]|uniref:Uncharacterized protein n=1 Tax=Leptidea sinapis TaxID=189913 RepID=A0A5E4R9Y3_9NEOP|nr:unnamed protein product [Leptidea sinapis]